MTHPRVVSVPYVKYCILYVIVISHYEWDIIVITRRRGKAKAECNNNDILV